VQGTGGIVHERTDHGRPDQSLGESDQQRDREPTSECDGERRETKSRLDVAASAEWVGTWTWDVRENVVAADEYLAEWYGVDPEEATSGVPIENFFASVHEADRERVRKRFDEAVEETGVVEAEYRVTDADGDVFAGLSLAQDVTERVERERELEERTERLDSFASMLAHELRNPVTIGQIYSQQLPDEIDSAAVEYVAEAFDRIEDMIDVMLVLTRGREAVGERTPVELADVAQEAWDDVDAPEATLEIGLDRTIRADETYVRHLFRNLLENAVEHGSTSNRTESGDAVEHAGRDVTIVIGDLPTGFYVADDGPGIPAEDRDAVFEAGYTTAAGQEGIGLGLAFVRELADVYDWTCAVAESESGGARFEFANIDQDPERT
jgi:signal transduction histidine kinase